MAVLSYSEAAAKAHEAHARRYRETLKQLQEIGSPNVELYRMLVEKHEARARAFRAEHLEAPNAPNP